MTAFSQKLPRSANVLRATGSVARGWRGAETLSILLFHRLAPAPDPLLSGVPTVVAFAALMRALRRCCTPLPLAEGLQRLADGSLPPRAVCITFDDGYADNLHLALPVLRSFGIPATVFVTTGFLKGGLMWNDRVIEGIRRYRGDRLPLEPIGLPDAPVGTLQERRALVDNLLEAIKHRSPAERERAVAYIEQLAPGPAPRLMLTDEEVRELAEAGVEVGAHTHTHPILASLGDAEAREEIRQGKAVLEDVLQQETRFFAYPNGRRGRDYLPQHVSLVREMGFAAALSTDVDANTSGIDHFQLQRFTPWDRGRLRFLARMMYHRGSATPGPRAQVHNESAEVTDT